MPKLDRSKCPVILKIKFFNEDACDEFCKLVQSPNYIKGFPQEKPNYINLFPPPFDHSFNPTQVKYYIHNEFDHAPCSLDSLRRFGKKIVRLKYQIDGDDILTLRQSLYFNFPIEAMSFELPHVHKTIWHFNKDGSVCGGDCSHPINTITNKYFYWLEEKLDRKLSIHPIFEVDKFLKKVMKNLKTYPKAEIQMGFGEFISDFFFWNNYESTHHARTKRAFCENLEKIAKKLDLPILQTMAVVGSWEETDEGSEVYFEIYEILAQYTNYTSRTRQARSKLLLEYD